MPIYEFKCLKCSKIWEEIQKINDELPKCSECNGNSEKIMSSCNFKFTGTGFYCTDYKNLNTVSDKKQNN